MKNNKSQHKNSTSANYNTSPATEKSTLSSATPASDMTQQGLHSQPGQHKITRRYSFDDNGGGYLGL